MPQPAINPKSPMELINVGSQLIQRMTIENLPWLIQSQKASAGGDNATNNSIVATNFAVLPQKPLHLAVNSNGGTWLMFAVLPMVIGGTTWTRCSFFIDGVEVTGKLNGLSYTLATSPLGVLLFWSQTLAPGSHTIDVVAKVDAGTGVVYADVNTQINLWAIEIK